MPLRLCPTPLRHALLVSPSSLHLAPSSLIVLPAPLRTPGVSLVLATIGLATIGEWQSNDASNLCHAISLTFSAPLYPPIPPSPHHLFSAPPTFLFLLHCCRMHRPRAQHI
jgi:hypothetical protein